MAEALLEALEKVTSPKTELSLSELLKPDLLTEDGHEPEQRVTYFGLSWERYLTLDKAFGDDRSLPRFYYLDGVLEVMTISNEHERIKKWVGNFLAMYLEAVEAQDRPRGEATIREALKKAGAEPDESWSFGEVKEYPDLVLEIALSSGGIEKLALYQRFPIPEVWFWRKGKLEIHNLRTDGSGYDLAPGRSLLLPDLDIALLERCVGILDWPTARKTFRTGLPKH